MQASLHTSPALPKKAGWRWLKPKEFVQPGDMFERERYKCTYTGRDHQEHIKVTTGDNNDGHCSRGPKWYEHCGWSGYIRKIEVAETHPVVPPCPIPGWRWLVGGEKVQMGDGFLPAFNNSEVPGVLIADDLGEFSLGPVERSDGWSGYVRRLPVSDAERAARLESLRTRIAASIVELQSLRDDLQKL